MCIRDRLCMADTFLGVEILPFQYDLRLMIENTGEESLKGCWLGENEVEGGAEWWIWKGVVRLVVGSLYESEMWKTGFVFSEEVIKKTGFFVCILRSKLIIIFAVQWLYVSLYLWQFIIFQ
eukprot:TRINITY_DN5177_c0_g2_i1.p2 TRINITY_DN5177_c0_g2~~TRINITY_DN5177_c0_g2_i1.p2  ORF type:complete len:121 (-),score=4.38 TRINITY_DN5177_c0_g2_i1:134-496(-)